MEEVPGLVHAADQTHYLEKHGYWPSYNVPYYTDIRQVNGNYPNSWQTAPRAQLFRLLQGNVTSIATLQSVLRWNKYQSTPRISGGNPCEAIACRADVRSTGTHPQSNFGAIDAKVSSYTSLFNGDRRGSNQNRHKVFAEAGPTHDDQPVFCWSKNRVPVSQPPPHHLHPDCFNFTFETITPVHLTPNSP